MCYFYRSDSNLQIKINIRQFMLNSRVHSSVKSLQFRSTPQNALGGQCTKKAIGERRKKNIGQKYPRTKKRKKKKFRQPQGEREKSG